MPDEAQVHQSSPAVRVRQVVLDDPATRNALSLAVRGKLVSALDEAAADRDCRAVILTGTGKTFASGSDIRMLASSTVDEATRPEIRRLWETMLAFPKPVVVALNGHALGGGLELALCGDIILAAAGVKLGQPEPKLGIMPGGGGTQRLVRALGHYRAARLLLTGEPIDAGTAERWGLVAEVCEPDALLPRAVAIATTMAALAPGALAAIKQAMRDGAGLPLADGLAVELAAFRRAFATADAREGLAAFLDKRPAIFTGD